MARARCDPFDVRAVRLAIERGESERSLYLAYAASAARPYARSTFTVLLKRGEAVEPKAATCAEVLERWCERAAVKPRILSLSPGGGLRVRRGALVAFDGAQVLTYTNAAKPPLAIVLSSAGGFVSIEAVRFCARARIAIVALNRSHGFLSVMTDGGYASAKLIRAQAAANPVTLARAIVAAKIEAMARAGALVAHDRHLGALARAPTLDQVRIVEAQASRVAWPDPPRLKWERGPIPADLAAPWLMRTRLDAKGKRGARHPVNAMLNAAFAVTAGRLAAYLAASGFAPAIGFLHADKRGRWSLAWDAIEPLRPAIEARVFRLIERERFDLSDFVRAPDGLLRLAPGLLAAVLNQCAPPHAALAQCVKWIERLILSAGQHGSGEADQPLRDARAFRLERRNAGLERATLGRLPIGSHGERV